MSNDSFFKRKSNRLNGYDYSSNGSYFLTICVKDLKCILSDIVGVDAPGDPKETTRARVILKPFGKIVESVIERNNAVYEEITVDKYVIMPNHIHLLISVNSESESGGALRASPPTNKVSNFVTALKKFTSKEIGENIWQRGFHDHIIRDEEDYLTRWQYIDENPQKWMIGKDKYYS